MHSKSQQRYRSRVLTSIVLITIATIASGPTLAATLDQSSSAIHQLAPASPPALRAAGEDAPWREAAQLRAARRHLRALHALALRAARLGPASQRRPIAPTIAPHAAPRPVTFAGHANWDAVAFCESHGQWNINSGNGYWGGLQFSSHTWFAYGGGPFDGSGYFPYSREQQITVAERILASQGTGAWPHCFVWG
jgi:hypothetical protein